MGADAIDSSWLTTLLIVVGTAISLWSLRRARLKSRQRERHSAEQLEELQKTSAMRSTADGIMVDLEAFARQMSAQLDTKCARLEALLDAADERLSELRRATGKQSSPATEAVETMASSFTEAATPEATNGVDVLVSDPPEVNADASGAITETIEADSDTATDADPDMESATETSIADASPADPPQSDDVEEDVAAGQDERNTIYELADLGHSALRIAQSLNRPVGEVELILQLRSFT